MSRKALEIEHLSLCRGCVRGTQREGSCTEGSYETCNGRLWSRSIFFIGLHKGNLRHLGRESSVSMFIGPEPTLDMVLYYV
jgi:hypothetical protein